MRKAQKQQLEDFLKLLEQAHNQVREMIDKKNIDMALKLLEECQNGAISVGTLIEKSEGEDFKTIPLVENYCEVIYQCYERLTNCEYGSSGKIYKTLKQSLIQVGNSIRNDIKIQKVAVFLPYKASMWDSLESIWKSADADPECEAYVIPIPYFDKNPDGSFREEHYEGNLYPDYVPITRYDKFDFENIHPDIIFIHNPYDECNAVTSVHPAFYSKKLKGYTDELVYIPYFILDEINPENEEAVKKVSHFCTVPGVVYADKVIVQSQDMRKIYIKAVTNWLGERQAEELRIKDKILGLGSPKVDKVLNTKKEELEIPEEWLKIIQKPDGSWKKIIFYNTSIGALLQHDVRMLGKMWNVFRIFKENQSEVALLWRPHPLIKATIEAMRPQLWKRYQELVAQYCDEGWGIYDDSVDMDRAVVISDAYYGDQSSVAALYEKTNKSILFQNLSCLERKQYQAVEDIYVDEQNNIWFTGYEINGLFCYETKTGRVKCVRIFDEYSEGNQRLFSAIVGMGDTLILVPMNADYIGVYKRQQDTFFKIALEQRDKPFKVKANFWNAMEYNGRVFMVGHGYPAIVRIDPNTLETEYFTDWYEPIKNEVKGQEYLFRNQGVVLGKTLFIPFCYKNAVLQFDLEQGSGTITVVGDKNDGFSGICFDGKDLWLSPMRDNKAIRWNVQKNSWQKYVLKEVERGEHLCVYMGCLSDEERVYFLSTHDLLMNIIDVNTGEIKQIPVFQGDTNMQKDSFTAPFRFFKKMQGMICFMNTYDGRIYGYDPKANKFQCVLECFELDMMEYLEKISEKSQENKKCPQKRRESSNIDLSIFLRTIKEYEQKKSELMAGELIYQKISDEI